MLEGLVVIAELDVLDDTVIQARPSNVDGRRVAQPGAHPRRRTGEQRAPLGVDPAAEVLTEAERSPRRWELTRERIGELALRPPQQLHDDGTALVERIREVSLRIDQTEDVSGLARCYHERRHCQTHPFSTLTRRPQRDRSAETTAQPTDRVALDSGGMNG